ncbi:hypothetical protein PCYB_074370 [Plasmodium cynomolgi strain B]|uniref:Pv-fam-d protein n=1 Tax=Plasmodium cynomolgi (strain B) TaxID=1120755 RepID=K6UD40_PLACD|nr:hypothetical protein PCYB_074370 [Plasmodium cynomolgi strain B]GAB65936.1 hypothetical protein PCYB_074370 [Plasmodium cynomolgi strain B]
MKEKTNKPRILSTKVFTFFLLVCTGKYPLESSTFGKSPDTKCHPRNAPTMQVSRILIGETQVQSPPIYPSLKEKLIDILDERNDDVFRKRLNALIQEEKYKKQFEFLFNGNKFTKDLSDLAINHEKLKAAGVPNVSNFKNDPSSNLAEVISKFPSIDMKDPTRMLTHPNRRRTRTKDSPPR